MAPRPSTTRDCYEAIMEPKTYAHLDSNPYRDINKNLIGSKRKKKKRGKSKGRKKGKGKGKKKTVKKKKTTKKKKGKKSKK